MRQRITLSPLTAYYFGLIALLYLPLGVLLVFSLNANTTLSVPLRGLTLDWYRQLFQADAVLRSVRNSLLVAAGSSLAATLLGSMLAILAVRYAFRFKRLLMGLAALPLSLPGVLAGFFMVFIPTVGEYVTPLLVGGTRGIMYGNIVQDFFTKAANWPFGAAMSMVMLLSTLLLVALALRLVDVRRLLD